MPQTKPSYLITHIQVLNKIIEPVSVIMIWHYPSPLYVSAASGTRVDVRHQVF